MDMEKKLINILNADIAPLSDNEHTYDNLMKDIGNARYVLIGEATHGTHEFYKARAEITQQLILEKDFMAVTIEGDWPAAFSVHRYLQGHDNKNSVKETLSEFKRFPQWMWRNSTLLPFLEWLRSFNDNNPKNKVGFYGLDLYSLNASMQAVISYLDKTDPDAAGRARARYSCFDHLGFDPQTYGYLASEGLKKSCIEEVISQVLELQYNVLKYVKEDSLAEEEFFYAAQNAHVVKDAEKYYRSMFEDHITSWNVRDTHMLETLNNISNYLEDRFQKPAKIIVWAHNSHVGDARATEMSERGEINIGQLAREHHGIKDTYLIGFSTNQGFVTAADDWDQPAQHKKINPGIRGSYEDLFHQLKYKNFILDLNQYKKIEHYLHLPRLQRAIGVIYRPETERMSHYFFTRLPYQFDSIIHFDETNAVQPLE
jgi:erythromycin esterase-like protein